jgi:hypothetical protein
MQRMPQQVWENAKATTSPRRIHRRYVREKATIDHLVKECYEAKAPERPLHSSRTASCRFLLELIRKMTPSLARSTPFRSRRSLAKVSANSGEPQDRYPRYKPRRPSASLIEATRSGRRSASRPIPRQRELLLGRADRNLLGRSPKAQVSVRARLCPGLVGLVDS